MVTMSQKSSVPQTAKSVSQALMSDSDDQKAMSIQGSRLREPMP
jgi:hypothetical protein